MLAMSHDNDLRFAQMMLRFQRFAHRCGEEPFVEALADSVFAMVAGDLDCPLAAMILDLHRLQSGEDAERPERAELLGSIRSFIDGRGTAIRDPLYTEAVLECESRRRHAHCPMYQAIAKSLLGPR